MGYHGYPRATVDMDVWTARTLENAAKLEAALREFGFDLPALSQELLLQPERVIRMGVPPVRIEINKLIPKFLSKNTSSENVFAFRAIL